MLRREERATVLVHHHVAFAFGAFGQGDASGDETKRHRPICSRWQLPGSRVQVRVCICVMENLPMCAWIAMKLRLLKGIVPATIGPRGGMVGEVPVEWRRRTVVSESPQS
jgi:hypothetical protein